MRRTESVTEEQAQTHDVQRDAELLGDDLDDLLKHHRLHAHRMHGRHRRNEQSYRKDSSKEHANMQGLPVRTAVASDANDGREVDVGCPEHRHLHTRAGARSSVEFADELELQHIPKDSVVRPAGVGGDQQVTGPAH